ncbi:MAG: homoserine dehydrogenase [Tissierellia bacterium]|nr:homoserine dehydrogenase [Tissierellia bacterium]
MKKINIGLLGFGTVGQGVAKIIHEKGEQIKASTGCELEIKKVLVRNMDKERAVKLPKELFTTDAHLIPNDPQIDLVIEVTGDVELSYELMQIAFKNKKHVVTANKAVVSAYFEELSELAAENGVYFLYEASVGGGIPVLKPLKDIIKLNEVSRVRGILNGTCNYILTKMTAFGADYGEVLKEAQELGYAEADPSSDVEGTDTQRKLRILASLAFGAKVTEEDILCLGIDKLSAFDIEAMKERGKVVKLVGDAKEVEGGYEAIVQPVAVSAGSYFSSVNQAFNSVAVSSDMVGEVKFYGAGAGMLPTANAVLTDCLDVATEEQIIANPLRDRGMVCKTQELKGVFYVRTEEKTAALAALEGEAVASSPYAMITKPVALKELLELLSSDPAASIIRMEGEDY